MLQAQAGFIQAVAAAPLVDPLFPLIGNVSASPLTTVQAIRLDLQNQLTNRVRWTESVQEMVSQGINTFIELGSSSVLCGLIKRIDRQVKCLSLGSPADFDALSALS